MKSIIQRIAEKNRQEENSDKSRRNFLKKAALGGVALGGFMTMSIEDTIAETTSNVQRSDRKSVV